MTKEYFALLTENVKLKQRYPSVALGCGFKSQPGQTIAFRLGT